MKTLFIGGIKSGKSRTAEAYTLNLADKKPYYLATTEFFDTEMQAKVAEHKKKRGDKFITLEEPLKLYEKLQHYKGETILVECVSMWINNMLYHKREEQEILLELEKLTTLPLNLIFVHNDVSCSVVSKNALVREFVDISGRASQLLASQCNEVYQVTAGLKVKLK